MAAKKEDLRYDAEIADRIREAFVAAYKDIKQDDVAELIETNQGTVSRYASGMTQIPLRVLLIVARKEKKGLDEIVRPPWVSSDALARIHEQRLAIEFLSGRVAELEREVGRASRPSATAPDTMGHRGKTLTPEQQAQQRKKKRAAT